MERNTDAVPFFHLTPDLPTSSHVGAQPKEETAPIVQPVGEEGFWALAQFLDYNKGQPLDGRTVFKEEMEGYTREKIVFSGPHKERVPGYLAIPTTGAGPFPAILTLHGLGGTKETWWQDSTECSDSLVTKGLLANGFAVLALDAQYHGERLQGNDYDPPWSILTSRQSAKFTWMFVESVVEYRLAIDYLATRPEIDTARIGSFGYSFGAQMAYPLTAVDSRIKVLVAGVGPPFGLTVVRNVVDKEMTVDRYRGYAASLNVRADPTLLQNYAHAIGSRPFLMLMGTQDEWYTADEAQQVFALVPSPTKELVFYDSGHILPPEHAAKAVAWFAAHLR